MNIIGYKKGFTTCLCEFYDDLTSWFHWNDGKWGELSQNGLTLQGGYLFFFFQIDVPSVE